MSLSEKTFLQIPLQNALKLYNEEIVPRLSKKNKVIAISAAVALSLIYFIQDRILKPPRHLRHLPYLSYFGTLKSMWKGESIWDRQHRLHLPLIESENNNGLFLVRLFFNAINKNSLSFNFFFRNYQKTDG